MNINTYKGIIMVGENTIPDQKSDLYPLSVAIVLSDGAMESRKWVQMINLLKRMGKKNVHFVSDSFPTIRMTHGYSIDSYFSNYKSYEQFINKSILHNDIFKRSSVTDGRESLLDRGKIVFRNRAKNIKTPYKVRLSVA